MLVFSLWKISLLFFTMMKFINKFFDNHGDNFNIFKRNIFI